MPQPLTTNTLDSVADRLMYRLAYRNFGSHESLVVNHSVAVSGGGGVRWYEIQSPGTTPVVAQQGTYAPDSNYRWMGSIAMDKIGDIALGYSVSSGAVYPSIAFAGRLPTDPPGDLEAETTVILGSGSQTPNVNRWGDYSSMSVDPSRRLHLLVHPAIPSSPPAPTTGTPASSASSFPAARLAAISVSIRLTSASECRTWERPALRSRSFSAINNPLASRSAASPSPATIWKTTTAAPSLAPNANCTINVSFKPTASGTRTGTLTVTDNGSGSPRIATLTGLGTEPAPACAANTLSNGGFESGTLDCWSAGGVLLPGISTLQAHSGSFSAQLGATGLPEPNGDSWLYQTITVPSGADGPTLSFWYWPSTSTTLQYDWQEAQIRDSNGNQLAQVFKVASNAQAWTQVTFDLTPYSGPDHPALLQRP